MGGRLETQEPERTSANAVQMLVAMLQKIFGKQQTLDQLHVTDGQGNVILEEVWEDLLEPGMTVVVDTRPMNGDGRNVERDDVRAMGYDYYNRRPDPTTRSLGHKRQSSLTSTGSIPIVHEAKQLQMDGKSTQLPQMVFDKVGDWDYSPSDVSPVSNQSRTSNDIVPIKPLRLSPPEYTADAPNGNRPQVPPSLPASALSQDVNQSNLLAPSRPPRPPTLSPLIIPDTEKQTDNPMHTMTLSPPVAAPMSSKERFAKTGGRFTAHFQALLSKRPTSREPQVPSSAITPQSNLMDRWKPVESPPRKQSLSSRRGLEPPTELVVAAPKPVESKQTMTNLVRRAKSLGNIRKDDLRIRHQASPSLPYIPPVPILGQDVSLSYLTTPYTNSTVASSGSSGVTYISTASTQPTSAEVSPIDEKPEPLDFSTYAGPSARSTQTPSPQPSRAGRDASRSPPLNRSPTNQTNNTPLHQSGPPPSKPLPKLPVALSAFPAPGPPPPLTQMPPQLFGPPKKLEVLTQPVVPAKSGKRIGIMGKKQHKPRSESSVGLGLGISMDGEVSPKEAKKEKKEEKEKLRKEKKEKKRKPEAIILKPLNVEGGKTVFDGMSP